MSSSSYSKSKSSNDAILSETAVRQLPSSMINAASDIVSDAFEKENNQLINSI